VLVSLPDFASAPDELPVGQKISLVVSDDREQKPPDRIKTPAEHFILIGSRGNSVLAAELFQKRILLRMVARRFHERRRGHGDRF
jgi:hypothetical protein